jgi:response regulator RpfG family c-di-GMP phosphodiesterase
MTPDMAFECLFVSPDPLVFTTMGRILQDFSISMNRCTDTTKAETLLADGSTDLIVIDLESDKSSEFLGQVRARTRQKPTVLAVSAADCVVAGVHVMLRKPVTHDSGVKSMKAAYSRMLRDYRKHSRFAVKREVVATDDDNRTLQITVTNVGEGGVGITSIETLRIGGILSFRMRLPELINEIAIQARVLWTRPYGAAGCEFVHVPPFDFQLLHAWLESRYRIKKPLVAI